MSATAGVEMSTYGELQAQIADELNRTDLTTQIQRAILSAIRHYRWDRFRFNTAVATTPTVSGEEYYDLPTDFVDADMLTLIDGTYRFNLREATWHWIEREKVTTDYSALPQYWAVYSQSIRLYPTPDDAYTLRIAYVYELPALSASSDANAWTNEAEELIRNRALAYLWRQVIRDEQSLQQAQIAESYEREAYSQLKAALNRQESTGRIAPDEFLSDRR